ncbi:MAG: hypothetical protein LC679_19790 [Intrasporangiaceae bacterium]|nr:hypothetical protein [Intrasporangiaceae bacterium]
MRKIGNANGSPWTCTTVSSTGRGLFPSILPDRGLAAALHRLGARSEIPVEVILDPEPLPRAEEHVEVSEHLGNGTIQLRDRVAVTEEIEGVFGIGVL